MTIQFFNTLSGKLEEFKPLDPKGEEVKIYTCGPTVYDYAHIGNFRTFVFEDLLRRFLEFKKFKVKHVMNLTDVDDKTIAGANRTPHPSLSPQGERVGVRGEDALARLNHFTEQYVEAFFEDLKTLNILPPNHPAEPPRATLEIQAMIDLIKKLVEKEFAYVKDDSVYYRIAAFRDYCKLSKKKLDKNISGARVDVDEYEKEEGADFALWKKSKEGEPAWDSPWGRGRPGWHIECSAMSMKYLGETFDIHAGGEDLIFPHHENEIAQSEAATGKQFVKYWLHAKHLIINGKKMSKKDKNFYTLRDLLAQGYDPMAIRYALISTHYRTPLNFTLDGLKEAVSVVERLRDVYKQCWNLDRKEELKTAADLEEKTYDLNQWIEDTLQNIDKALSSDLNVSEASAEIFEIVKHINYGLRRNLLHKKRLQAILNFFSKIEDVFGLNILEVESIPEEVWKWHQQRATFRRDSNFKKDPALQKLSDDLRLKIDKAGFEVRDGKPGEDSFLKRKPSLKRGVKL